jgi:hypothetical protein
MQDETKNEPEPKPLIVWETFQESTTYKPKWKRNGTRARVLGGWLVCVADMSTTVFVPDPDHTWGKEGER